MSSGLEAPDTGHVVQTRRTLLNAPDEITHLVCCRDPEWRTAFCGAESDHINVNGQVLCSMCMEVVLEKLPDFFETDPVLCPLDRRPCPDDHEVDLRILREVSP